MPINPEIKTQVIDNLKKAASAIRELAKTAANNMSQSPVINIRKLKGLLNGTGR